MISKKITIHKEILNPDFIVMTAKICSSFNCSVTMYAKDRIVNLKSIVNIFATKLESTEEVELVFDGNDEEDACNTILDLFQ